MEPLLAVVKRWGDYIPADVALHYPRSKAGKLSKQPRRGDFSHCPTIPLTWPDEMESAVPTTEARWVLTEVCGLSMGQLWTIRVRGGLTDEQADQCAVRLGMAPQEIWGDLWSEVEERALFDQIRREVA